MDEFKIEERESKYIGKKKRQRQEEKNKRRMNEIVMQAVGKEDVKEDKESKPSQSHVMSRTQQIDEVRSLFENKEDKGKSSLTDVHVGRDIHQDELDQLEMKEQRMIDGDDLPTDSLAHPYLVGVAKHKAAKRLKKLNMERLIEERTVTPVQSMFVSPLDMSDSSDEDSSDSDDSDDDEKSRGYITSSTIGTTELNVTTDKRSQWSKTGNRKTSQTEQEKEDAKQDKEIMKMDTFLRDSINKYMQSDNKEKRISDTHAFMIKLMREAKTKYEGLEKRDPNKFLMIKKTTKYFTEQTPVDQHKVWCEQFVGMLIDSGALENKHKRIIDIYWDIKHMVLRVPKVKINPERALGFELNALGVQIATIITCMSQLKPNRDWERQVLDGFAAAMVKVKDKNSIVYKYDETVNLIETKILYDIGVGLQFKNITARPIRALTSEEYKIVTYNENLDGNLRQLLTHANIMIFDTANMTRAMNISTEEIMKFAKALVDVGISVINITDDEACMNKFATINIIISATDHDDIIMLLYSQLKKAVIVTNDTHKEFKDNIQVCKKHRTIIARKKEICPMSGDKPCMLTSISWLTTRYCSINKIHSTKEGEIRKVDFDAPLVRFKKTKKKGILSITFPGDKKDDLMYWSLENGPNTPLYLRTVKSDNIYKRYTVVTTDGTDGSVMLIGTSKYNTLSYLLNTLTVEQIKEIKQKVEVIVMYDENGVQLKDTENHSTIISDDRSMVYFKGKMQEKIISGMFDINKTIISRSEYVTTLFDRPRKNIENEDIAILMNTRSLELGIAFIVDKSKSKYYLANLGKTFTDLVESAVIKKVLADEHDEYLKYLPLTASGRTQIMHFRKHDDNQDFINKMVNVAISRSEIPFVDFSKFKSQPFTWSYAVEVDLKLVDIKKDNSMFTDVENGRQQLYSVPNSVKPERLINALAKVYEDEYYNLHDKREIFVNMNSLHEKDRVRHVKLLSSDANLVYVAVTPIIKKIVEGVMQDISIIFNNMVTNSISPILPPLLWALKHFNLKPLKEESEYIVRLKLSLYDMEIDSFTGVNSDRCITTVRLYPTFKTIFPLVALMHMVDYSHYNENDGGLPQLVQSSSMQLMEYDWVLDNLDKYICYHELFFIPLMLTGMHPATTILKQRPIIEDNIVVGLCAGIEFVADDLSNEMQFDIKTFVEVVGEDFFASLTRCYKPGTNHINVNAEIHYIINALVNHYEKYIQTACMVTLFSLIIPLDRFVYHMINCYGLSISENSDISMVIEALMFNETICDCILQHDHRVITTSNTTNLEMGKVTKRNTSSGVIIADSRDTIKSYVVARHKQSWLVDSLPLHGSIIVLSIKESKAIKKIERSGFAFKLLKHSTNIKLREVTLITNRNNTIIEQIKEKLLKHTHANDDIVLMATDKIGSLIKQQHTHVDIDLVNRTIYVTDAILLSAIKSYMHNVHTKEEKEKEPQPSITTPKGYKDKHTRDQDKPKDANKKLKVKKSKHQLREEIISKMSSRSNLALVVGTIIVLLMYVYWLITNIATIGFGINVLPSIILGASAIFCATRLYRLVQLLNKK